MKNSTVNAKVLEKTICLKLADWKMRTLIREAAEKSPDVSCTDPELRCENQFTGELQVVLSIHKKAFMRGITSPVEVHSTCGIKFFGKMRSTLNFLVYTKSSMKRGVSSIMLWECFFSARDKGRMNAAKYRTIFKIQMKGWKILETGLEVQLSSEHRGLTYCQSWKELFRSTYIHVIERPSQSSVLNWAEIWNEWDSTTFSINSEWAWAVLQRIYINFTIQMSKDCADIAQKACSFHLAVFFKYCIHIFF